MEEIYISRLELWRCFPEFFISFSKIYIRIKFLFSRSSYGFLYLFDIDKAQMYSVII
jgi:hypothetical protein